MRRVALNHMAAPGLAWRPFLGLARDLGCVGVEFRNDLPRPLFDGEEAGVVARAAADMGLRVLALAEVKAFNDFDDGTLARARDLAATAIACGAEAISLIPRNDGRGLGNGERQANLRLALRELKPVLEEAGLFGFVEPLGFEVCSLRTKAEAVDAMHAVGGEGVYRLIHDTFHHYVAGETEFFADMTGMVHVSGVSDPKPAVRDLRDAHRILVDARDRLGNLAQIERLADGGYSGPISFEPFAPDVIGAANPGEGLRASIGFIAGKHEELAT